jgi:8-oxo-dGTP pyrophosphatase MutT (NUDIX family)
MAKFLTKSAVMLFLFRDKNGRREILLQKRLNTGYMDGMWDCSVSGHVEEKESMMMALQREAKEEINIVIRISNINFATLVHRHTHELGSTYYDGYFFVHTFEGTPSINESGKCSDLRWFAVNDLPSEFLSDRKRALNNYLNNVPYDEIGWDDIMSHIN